MDKNKSQIEKMREVKLLIKFAIKELASSKPKAAPLLEALQQAQSYLLTLPQGADREILNKINDAIKKPQPPHKLKEALEALQSYLSTLKVPDEPDNGMKCKYCGCTSDHACEGGCSWVAKDVCSKCAAELSELQKILLSDDVQHIITKIKERLGLNDRDISQQEHYQIYEELIKEGYPIQKYLKQLKESDKLVDEIVKNSKSPDELRFNLNSAGYSII